MVRFNSVITVKHERNRVLPQPLEKLWIKDAVSEAMCFSHQESKPSDRWKGLKSVQVYQKCTFGVWVSIEEFSVLCCDFLIIFLVPTAEMCFQELETDNDWLLASSNKLCNQFLGFGGWKEDQSIFPLNLVMVLPYLKCLKKKKH